MKRGDESLEGAGSRYPHHELFITRTNGMGATDNVHVCTLDRNKVHLSIQGSGERFGLTLG